MIQALFSKPVGTIENAILDVGKRLLHIVDSVIRDAVDRIPFQIAMLLGFFITKLSFPSLDYKT